MSNTPIIASEFIEQATAKILENVSNEQFGVSELAEAMNMSRSTLLRKVKKDTQLSASQFIRQVRLQKGMEILKQTSSTVSEVSFQVGFGSTSYFIKCFREYYGHPPGEVGKTEIIPESVSSTAPKKRHGVKIAAAIGIIFMLITIFLLNKTETTGVVELEKSIAVLPFKNDSNDSSNLYFVNGLMESSLSSLQKIKDLRVISRTSVEKYRNTDKTIPEIAEELNVSYLIEGSGQRIGDRVLLNVQLIEAATDRHIWAEQYSREFVDIFDLQNEIATKVATAIEAIVTPEELEQIERKITDNLQAYDYYLQALEPYYLRTKDGLLEAIPLFEEAIKHDPQFALAHADLAISYYHLDIFQTEKKYTELINNYADKALLYDSKLARSIIAKALYYMHIEEYELALPHLEQALVYNPNSSAVVQMLGLIYASFLPNTAKYLEYALKGIQLDIAANDSITQSFIYLQLGNALIQSGFVDEAYKYINLSLDYNPDNPFAPYVHAFVSYARDYDLEKTKQSLVREWYKDTTRLDLLQEVAKMYYLQEDYDSSFIYYQKFVTARSHRGLSIYKHEDCKIGLVYQKIGRQEEADKFFDSFAQFCEKDESIYKSASMAVKLTIEGRLDDAIEQLNVFATQNHYQYWILLFMGDDPLLQPLKSHPEFEEAMLNIKKRFWQNHEQLKRSLVEKKLI